MLIQAGIQDERDELLEETSMLENFCEETKKTLETVIANDQTMLSNAQTELAAATEKEATAGETARQTAVENQQLNDDLDPRVKSELGRRDQQRRAQRRMGPPQWLGGQQLQVPYTLVELALHAIVRAPV